MFSISSWVKLGNSKILKKSSKIVNLWLSDSFKIFSLSISFIESKFKFWILAKNKNLSWSGNDLRTLEAEKYNCDVIRLKTWIFVDHPLLLKKLGFKQDNYLFEQQQKSKINIPLEEQENTEETFRERTKNLGKIQGFLKDNRLYYENKEGELKFIAITAPRYYLKLK